MLCEGHYIGCRRSVEAIPTRWLIAISLPSWIVGSPSTILKFASFLSMSPHITKFAIELQSATIFNGVTILVIMIIMFAFGLIVVVVLTTSKCCYNRKVFCSLRCHLSLGIILNNKIIGLLNIKQWWHHENIATDSAKIVIEALEKLHYLILFSFLQVWLELITNENSPICFQLIS